MGQGVSSPLSADLNEAGAAPAAVRFLPALPLLYLCLHGLALVLLPSQATFLSFLFLGLTPLLAAAACFTRLSSPGGSRGWIAVALAMVLWSAGMATSMVATLFVGISVDALSVLLYVLYGVPLIFAMASPDHELWYVRLGDGALALALGYLFFEHTFAFATLTGTNDEGLLSLRLMFDIENLFIALFALVRFGASTDVPRRALFGPLAAFAATYLVAAGYINHLQMNTEYGTLVDLVIDLPFLVLAILALGYRPKPVAATPLRRGLAHLVRAGSPLMLAVTLLVVSALLVHDRPGLAIAGFVTATLGVGIRSMLVQSRSFEERDRLDELARLDALTGLPNRRQFDDVLHREWGRARRTGESLALLMIDIDHFKQLNDSYGHPVGDERLRAVGRTLAECATRGTDLVARYGGEEFAAILPGADMAQARALADMMRTSVAQLRLASPAAIGFVTVSIGVSCVGSVGSDEPNGMLERADAALYEAKKAGRNQVAHRMARSIAS